ncbi:MAG: hypothetical protein A2X49_06760 [Lentisphaerae bacterium GWF2_52_8]|nr:MAG: hypothetical protein A2X49_06760 [Lentisphaerae bacterium GWF2_52_8]
MKSACLTGLRKVEVLELPRPERKNPDDVLVRIKSCGVCGSDVHYYRDGRIGPSACSYPHYIGHEPAGVVEEAKPGSSFSPGDRVAIEPGLNCGVCEFCRDGRPNICPSVKFLASPGVPGAFQEYLVLRESQLLRLPDNLGFDEGAMLEPLGIAWHAVLNLAKLQHGESIAVFGAGPIGLLILSLAKIYGCGEAFISDPLDWRLDFAKRHCGADFVLNPEKDDVPRRILEESKGRGVDLSFEAAGMQQSIDHSFEAVRIGGKAVLAGIPEAQAISYNPHLARRKELQILNVRRSKQTLKDCTNLAASGKIKLGPYVTHRFSLDETASAFELVDGYRDKVIRAVINP